ncbi:MAG: hypothetical protein ACRYHQ_05545 [Janthinobacterium lividum]
MPRDVGALVTGLQYAAAVGLGKEADEMLLPDMAQEEILVAGGQPPSSDPGEILVQHDAERRG